MRRRLLMALACTAPFALAPWGAARLAGAAGAAIGSAVARAVSALPAPGPGLLDPPLPQEATSESAEVASVIFEELPEIAAASAPGKGAKKKPSSVTPRPARSIRISAATVLRLVRLGVRPSGVFVPAEGDRPAGLALQGVSPLSVGLQDGDVLTHVDGVPASSVGAVVGAVLASRQRRAPAISGRVYRGSALIAISVEMPYPK